MSTRHRMRGLLVTLVIAVATLDRAHASEPPQPCPPHPVRIGLPDFPAGEFLKGKGDRFADPDPGHLVRELREVEQRMGCRFELVRLPMVRMIRDASSGSVDLVTPAPETLAQAQGWVLPRAGARTNLQMAIGHSPLSLFVVRARQEELGAAWVAEGQPKGTVGVVAGTVPADHAKAKGWPTQTIQDFDKGLTMLMLQRVDHVFVPAISLQDNDRIRQGEVVALEPPVMSVAYFHAALPPFAQRHPDFLRAFWRAVCQASLPRRTDKPTCKL